MPEVRFLHNGTADVSEFVKTLRKMIPYEVVDISKAMDYLCVTGGTETNVLLLSDQFGDKG